MSMIDTLLNFGCEHVAAWDAWFTPSKDMTKATMIPAFGIGSREFAKGSTVGIWDDSNGFIYRVSGFRPWLTAIEEDHKDVHLELLMRL